MSLKVEVDEQNPTEHCHQKMEYVNTLASTNGLVSCVPSFISLIEYIVILNVNIGSQFSSVLLVKYMYKCILVLTLQFSEYILHKLCIFFHKASSCNYIEDICWFR